MRCKYHCLKSDASIKTIAFFTSVFVRTNSLFDALYTTSMTLVFRVQFSLPQLKFPVSRRNARTLVLPPRQRTRRTRLPPIFVIDGGRPISNLRFFWWMLRFTGGAVLVAAVTTDTHRESVAED